MAVDGADTIEMMEKYLVDGSALGPFDIYDGQVCESIRMALWYAQAPVESG